MNSSIIIILCAINIVLTKHYHFKHHHQSHIAELLNSKENFFCKTNTHIQNIMNQLFEELDITKEFIGQPKIKLLLTMHYDLNNIAEKNFEIYDVLRNVTAVTVEDRPANKIGLNEKVREILSENKFNVSDEIQHNKNKHINRSVHKPKGPPSGFNDSREFKEFIKGFLGKINRLTVDDLFKKKSSSKLRKSARRNLKVWEPPLSFQPNWLTNNTESRRIYRGKKTNIETFPFVVSIHILDDFMCAGSIIARDLVLTAASCVQIHYNNRYFRENPKTTYVRIGSEWISRRGEIVPILEIFFYPTYDPKTLKHNIAILRLERTIKFQTRRKTKIRRIQLDHGDGNLPANTRDVVILGWGAKKPNQIINTFEKLNFAFLDIYPIDECRQIYSKEYIAETNFCAGFMSRGGGACNRDVGAPGIVGGLLVGVVSFGAPVCGALDAPTVYTRVGHYINWIEPIMEDHPPRYGKPKTTKMTSKALVYYFNTITARTYPHISPVTPRKVVYPLRALRAQDDKESPEEDVLQEIITDIVHQNDTMIHDIIDEDLSDDFFDIFNSSTTAFPNIAAHPLINKTLYLIPGIHFEATTRNFTMPTLEPTYEFDTTLVMDSVTDINLRMNGTTDTLSYGAYDNNNYESAPKETQKDGYVSTDSQESRQEYLEKHTTQDDYIYDASEENLNEKHKITKAIYAKQNAVTEDDYSRDVAFDI